MSNTPPQSDTVVEVSEGMKKMVDRVAEACQGVGARPHSDNRCDHADQLRVALLSAIGKLEYVARKSRATILNAVESEDGLEPEDGWKVIRMIEAVMPELVPYA